MSGIKYFNTIGKEEEEAVLRVIRSGCLSGYVAGKSEGGPEVEALKKAWREFFGIPYASACNSATSGLLAACMAIGIGPGDEVIVPYFTMSATGAAPKVLGANLVYADIDEHFCIDPNEVGKLINENTKAVIAVNLFGHPARLRALKMICESTGTFLIEDNSQAIMAKENGRYTGTIGHMGVFSLNVHKHIQTGEGGMIVTDNPLLHERLEFAINHGEMRGWVHPGLNLRMTEITAAIAQEQLKKLPEIVASRQQIASDLIEAISLWRFGGEPVLRTPAVRTDCEHVYYAFPMIGNPSFDTSTIYGAWTNRRCPIPISLGYHGNLPRIWPDGKRWRDPAGLMLIETCSFDIKQEHIDQLKVELSK